MNKLQQRLLTLFNHPIPKHYLFKLLLVTFMIKMLTVLYVSYLWSCSGEVMLGRIAVSGGDTFSYIGAMDNYIEKGEYYFIKQENENVRKYEKAYAGRMPYYGIIYYVLRYFLSKELASDSILFIQVLLESLSIITLAVISHKVLKTMVAFWVTFFIFIISLTISTWSVFLIPESLSLSFSIFFIYYYYCYLSDENRSYYFLALSGFFIALLVLLKPYFILLYLIIGLEFLWHRSKSISLSSISDISKRTIIVSSFLILFLLPWTIRNYRLLDKFIPLQSGMDAGYGFSSSHIACNNFIKAWGGNVIYWDFAAAGSYFIPAYSSERTSFPFPDYAFSKSYNLEDVKKVRNKYIELQNNYSDSLDVQVAKEFDQLTALYKTDRPVQYAIISPLILTKKFLLTATSQYLPYHPDSACYKSYHYLIIKSQAALYYVLLLFGLIGLIYIVKKDQKNFIFLSIPLLLLILFPISLRLIEGRYLINMYPFLVVGTVATFNYILKRIYTKKLTKDLMIH